MHQAMAYYLLKDCGAERCCLEGVQLGRSVCVRSADIRPKSIFDAGLGRVCFTAEEVTNLPFG